MSRGKSFKLLEIPLHQWTFIIMVNSNIFKQWPLSMTIHLHCFILPWYSWWCWWFGTPAIINQRMCCQSLPIPLRINMDKLPTTDTYFSVGFLFLNCTISWCLQSPFDFDRSTTSWWMTHPTRLKDLSQFGSFPQIGLKITTCLKPPPRQTVGSSRCLKAYPLNSGFLPRLRRLWWPPNDLLQSKVS